MADELKPVRCGCGGKAVAIGDADHNIYFVKCDKCWISTDLFHFKAEAIEAWNRAMGERTAKVIEHDASITDDRGYKYLRSEYLCENCKKKVIGGDKYCPNCGARLEWE